jgi:hypothetical protein
MKTLLSLFGLTLAFLCLLYAAVSVRYNLKGAFKQTFIFTLNRIKQLLLRKKIVLVGWFVLSCHLTFAQGLIGLVDRQNTAGTTTAEGFGISAVGLSRGAGIIQETLSGNYNSRGFVDTSLTNAKTNNDYLQFSLEVNTGSVLDLNEMKIRLDRSPSGPRKFQLEYSLNAFNSSSVSLNSDSIRVSGSIHTISLTGISTLSAGAVITFRIYAWGATATNGTLDVEGFSSSYSANGWTPSITSPGIAFKGCSLPVDPTSVSNSSLTGNSSVISWNNPSCFSNIVVIGSASSVTAAPAASIDPSAWSASADWSNPVSVYSQMGSGSTTEFVLYRGSGTSVTITNLPTSGTFFYKVYTAFSSWSSGAIGSMALPVTLISFTATQPNTNIELHWRTASELNNNYFEIQKSTDGILFSTIGQVSGKGTTNELSTYTYIDDVIFPVAYYQLKQVDYDGVFSLSKIIKMMQLPAFFKIQNTFLQCNVSSLSEYPTDYILTTTNGSVLARGSFQEELVIHKNLYSKGLYFLIINSNGRQQTIKWSQTE